jgi:hypothetical protein
MPSGRRIAINRDKKPPEVVRRYLESYQIQYEGKVTTDDQAMEMWRALDRPGCVCLREH